MSDEHRRSRSPLRWAVPITSCLWIAAPAGVAAMTIFQLPSVTRGSDEAPVPTSATRSVVVHQAFRLAYAVRPGALTQLIAENESRDQDLEELEWTGLGALPELLVLGVSQGEARAAFELSDPPIDFVFEEDFRPAAFLH